MTSFQKKNDKLLSLTHCPHLCFPKQFSFQVYLLLLQLEIHSPFVVLVDMLLSETEFLDNFRGHLGLYKGGRREGEGL